MGDSFWFWSQNLNMTGLDPVMRDGVVLEQLDDVQKTTPAFVNVQVNGRKIADTDNVAVYWHKGEYMIRLNLPYRDRVGRRANVFVYGTPPDNLPSVEEYTHALRNSLQTYMTYIESTSSVESTSAELTTGENPSDKAIIPDELYQSIQYGANTIVTEARNLRLRQYLFIAIAMTGSLLILILIYRLYQYNIITKGVITNDHATPYSHSR